MAQLCVRPKGDPHCPLHPKQNVILSCKDCPSHTLVCQTCIISIHEGHKFGDMLESFTQKVENIKQFITKTETLTMPQLIADISAIVKKKKTTTEMFQSEIRTAREQAEQLGKLVDLHMIKTVSSIESELKDTLASLDSYQRELEQFKSELEEEMKDTKTVLTSDCNMLVLDVEAEIMKKSDDCIPPSPNISVPHFVPCKDPLPYIEKAFGELEIKNTSPKEKLSGDATTIATSPAATSQSKHKPSMNSYADGGVKPKAPHRIKRILDQPIQLTTLNWRSYISSLCPIPNNMAWVCTKGDKQLDLINDKRTVHKILALDIKLRAICLHPSTGDVYGCCWSGKSIRHFNIQSKGELETTVLFHTDSAPYSIACTSHNVIVGMEGKVCMYTYEGQVVYNKDIGEFCVAFYISVCTRTNRIAVACDGSDVCVLDSKLLVLYTYKGECAVKRKHLTTLKREKFTTFCAVFDDNGNLLVGDCDNKEVHILDDKATCISTIKTKDMAEVDRFGAHDGVLWVGCMATNRIVIVKYMD